MYVLFPLFFDFYPVMRSIYAGSSAGMKKDDFLSLFYPAFSYHFKKTCEGFSRVAWIEDDGFLFGHIVHGVSDFPACCKLPGRNL